MAEPNAEAELGKRRHTSAEVQQRNAHVNVTLVNCLRAKAPAENASNDCNPACSTAADAVAPSVRPLEAVLLELGGVERGEQSEEREVPRHNGGEALPRAAADRGLCDDGEVLEMRPSPATASAFRPSE